MRGPMITPETMKKAWLLHNKGIDSNLIAHTLGISQHSAQRIIKIMTAAQNGEDVDALEDGRYEQQKAFAKKFFGIEDKKAKPENQNTADDITKDFMQKVLGMLAWQNELLEQFLDSFGVDWKTHCKGVERR